MYVCVSHAWEDHLCFIIVCCHNSMHPKTATVVIMSFHKVWWTREDNKTDRQASHQFVNKKWKKTEYLSFSFSPSRSFPSHLSSFLSSLLSSLLQQSDWCLWLGQQIRQRSVQVHIVHTVSMVNCCSSHRPQKITWGRKNICNSLTCRRKKNWWWKPLNWTCLCEHLSVWKWKLQCSWVGSRWTQETW